MRKFNFILLVTISSLLEYCSIFLILYFVFKWSLIVCILIPLIFLFVAILFCVTARKLINKGIFSSTVDNSFEDVTNEMVKVAKEKCNLDLKVEVVDATLENPAWVINNTIYINAPKVKYPELLKGIIAHEIGHSISGVDTVSIFNFIRLSSLINRLIYLLLVKLAFKNTFIVWVLLPLYYLSDIFGNIFIYPYIRKDEIFANSKANELGFGDSLRAYYVLNDLDNKLFRCLDVLHPNVDKMIRLMSNNKEYNEVKYNGVLYRLLTTYKTCIIDSDVVSLYPSSIKSKQLIKLTLKGVKRIDYSSIKYSQNIEILVLPSILYIDTIGLKKFKNLKEIRIGNEDFVEKLKSDLPNIKIKLIK